MIKAIQKKRCAVLATMFNEPEMLDLDQKGLRLWCVAEPTKPAFVEGTPVCGFGWPENSQGRFQRESIGKGSRPFGSYIPSMALDWGRESGVVTSPMYQRLQNWAVRSLANNFNFS